MDTLEVARPGAPAVVPSQSTLLDPDSVRLRQQSVRELIADLARLEDAHRSTSASSSSLLRDRDLDRSATQERRIIAELHRRRSALRRTGNARPCGPRLVHGPHVAVDEAWTTPC